MKYTPKKGSKREKIFKHLKLGHGITKRQSDIEYNYLNLGEFIRILREAGYNIVTDRIGKSKFASYRLITDE